MRLDLRGLVILALALVLGLGAGGARAEGLRGVVGQDREHVVAPGENLYGLAQQYGLAIEHLAFANGLSPTSTAVAPGTRLLVPGRRVLPANPPSDGLVVNLPERGVFLFRGGAFEKFYPLAIGQPGRFATPQGSFSIASRVVNPAWMPPEWAGLGAITVPAGPENPLGDRWIGLSLPGVGLHATTSPMSVGQAASHGCMRMYPASARDLFDRVWVGMPVRIEYETLKAGYDARTGAFYLVAFPDVYGQSSPRLQVQPALEDLGLAGLVDPGELERLARPTGVARRLLASDVAVTVGRRKLQLSLPPILRNGNLWVSTEVTRALGLEVSWDAATRVVEVRRDDRILVFPVGSAEAPPETPAFGPRPGSEAPAPEEAPAPPAPAPSAGSPAPEAPPQDGTPEAPDSPEGTGTPASPQAGEPLPQAVESPQPAEPPAPPPAPERRLGGSALLVGGRALVPIRPVLDAFALPYRWDAAGRTLHIDG